MRVDQLASLDHSDARRRHQALLHHTGNDVRDAYLICGAERVHRLAPGRNSLRSTLCRSDCNGNQSTQQRDQADRIAKPSHRPSPLTSPAHISRTNIAGLQRFQDCYTGGTTIESTRPRGPQREVFVVGVGPQGGATLHSPGPRVHTSWNRLNRCCSLVEGRERSRRESSSELSEGMSAKID